MAHSKAANTANLKPFKKGADPKRNTGGNKNKEAQAFSILFRNALAKKMSPDELAELLVANAKKNKPWAIEEILDRLIGKVTQPISGDVNTVFRVIYDPEAKDK